MKLFKNIHFLACIFSIGMFAQQPATSSKEIIKNLEEKEHLTNNSLVKNVTFHNIGPTIMSGRVVDLDVNPNNPTEFYVAYASGGLWYTNNNGTSFKPVMDNAPTQNIGDIAVDWNNQTIWVGTGENNSSRSSYAGIGILKSDDAGKTWTNVGLNDSHHIGRIRINPNNPNDVLVAVIGHLYSPNAERGVFKTVDGGKTWTKTLFINEDTGIIDLVPSPNDFNVLYAAAWERDRKAWNFKGSGEHSAIYKSVDGGKTWTKITNNNGFPSGDGVGRIGLSVNSNDEVYAFLDNQFRRKKEDKKESDDLSKEDFKTMSEDAFLKLDDKKLNKFLKTNGFQEKYRAENVKQLVRSGNVKPEDIAKYLEDANSMLFDTPIIGAELYKTSNGGKTWSKTHEGYIDDLVYSYGYYFGVINSNPKVDGKVYIAGVPILKSTDGGKTFTSINGDNVHVDHHAIWINPNNPKHLIIGNDGGVNISYDDGETWIKCNTPSVGQFYTVNVDNQDSYNVYGGLQDNGVWVGPNHYKASVKWHEEGEYPYKRLLGGDGMQVAIDSRNPNIVYTGFQFGNYYRIDRNTEKRTYILPKHELGESPYRFNWQTPIQLSSHNQDILYLGGNKLMRSMNQGDDWQAISNDLTKGGKKGNVAYGTITSISESPFQFGLIYTGSDDGLVYFTKNSGGSWTNISPETSGPKDLWVSRVIASQHKKERVYVTLNGYRWDDFKAYVYMSDDYGNTWKSISNTIPDSPVNVIKEDPENENLLYVGTDNGLYVSFDKGQNWQAFSKDLPNVAVHDLVIQNNTKDLVIGTHGRSLYKANIASLQKLTDDILKKNIHLFDVETVKHGNFWGNSYSTWSEPREPEFIIPFYTSNAGNYDVKILFEDDVLVYETSVEADKGYNELIYNLSTREDAKDRLKHKKDIELKAGKNGTYYLPKGDYTIKIKNEKTTFKIE